MSKLIAVCFVIWPTLSFAGPKCDAAAAYLKENKDAIEAALAKDPATLARTALLRSPAASYDHMVVGATSMLQTLKTALENTEIYIKNVKKIYIDSDCEYGVKLLQQEWGAFLNLFSHEEI